MLIERRRILWIPSGLLLVLAAFPDLLKAGTMDEPANRMEVLRQQAKTDTTSTIPVSMEGVLGPISPAPLPSRRTTPLWRLRPALPAPRVATDPNAPIVNVAREAALMPPRGGDLDPTIDVQITQEIIEKAAELGSAQAIYEFVRNECEFQPYYGSRKGSVETLRQRAGNDYDLASLMIALLRASNIPSRYAVGLVEMPAARVKSWLAVDEAEVAGSILFTNGMEGTSIISGPDVIAVRARRVWVEAYLPRGFGSSAWVPLDPAFHLTTVHSGIDIPQEMGPGGSALDAIAFVDEYFDPSTPGVTLPRAETPIEILKDNISAYISAHYPGMTLDDVKRTHEVLAEHLGILPNSLPYTVRSRDSVFSEIPANRRYQVRFHLLDGATTLIDYTADLPTIAGKRVTIDYVGATPVDQAILDANGGIYATAPSTVDLKPVLRIEGQQVALGAVGVGMGLIHDSDLYFLAPVNGQGLPQNVVPAIFNSIVCGASQAIALGIEGAAESMLVEPPAGDAEGTLSMLWDTGMDYLAHVRNDDLELARLMHSYVTTDVTSAILENVVNVTYNGFGVPQTFAWAGLRVDADRAIAGLWPVDRLDPPGAEPRDFLVIGGANGSSWENFIFERGFDQDSVSTMQILQYAIDSGVTVYKRWNTLPLPANTQPTSVRTALQNEILNGKEVTFPADPMTIGAVGTGQWTGTGWITMDPADGAAGYIISGNNNGGATFEFWPPEFIDLQEGDRSVTNVSIEITDPDADSPDSNALFTRDNEQNLEFKYLLHVTYSDSSTATLGPYTKTTRNTTKTFSPGNYTFHVWVARFAWFNFGIWHAERKVSIVGVLVRKDDGSSTGLTPPSFICVKPPPPGTTPFVNLKALVIPSQGPGGANLVSGYSWSAGARLSLATPTQPITRLEPAGMDPSGAVDDQNVDVVVNLVGGASVQGYRRFHFAAGSQDEKHKMSVISVDQTMWPDENDVLLQGAEVKFTGAVQPTGLTVEREWSYSMGTGNPATATTEDFLTTLTSTGDLEVKLKLKKDEATCELKRKIKGVKPEVTAVTFKNDLAMSKWATGGAGSAILDPVWTKTLGGAVTKNEPAAYVRSTMATVDLRLAASMNLSDPAVIRVQGRGDEDFAFDETTVQDWTYVPGALELTSTALHTSNNAYDPMGVTWEYVVRKVDGSFPPFTSAVTMNMTSHRVYTTYAAPLESPLYDLALEKACLQYASGGTAAASIASSLNSGIDGDLFYDPGSFVGGNPLNAYSAGACLCWNNADLLRLLARSIGIGAELRFFYGGLATPNAQFFNFTTVPTGRASMRTTAGAHDGAPALAHFTYHVQTLISGTYYDPSYGTVGRAASSHQCTGNGSVFLETTSFYTGTPFCGWSDPHAP